MSSNTEFISVENSQNKLKIKRIKERKILTLSPTLNNCEHQKKKVEKKAQKTHRKNKV
jgi:hypothetical protein